MTHDILTRGVSNVTPRDLAEKKLGAKKPLRIYLGIDPTGARLHIGHSVPLRKLRAFQDAGHHVTLVVGSFTAMIGDPTGRDTMREALTREQVRKNYETYREQAKLILDFDKLEIRENHEWLETLKFEDIIKLASNFTLQQMMERDMFEKRLSEGAPIGLHEFFYPLMVGYDSVMLDVDCEIGGNDQYFNMLCGRTLQGAMGKRDKFVLTTKLIEGTDGRKMSKSYDNCIYLTDAPKDMYGKTMSMKDESITSYMECCTSIAMEEIIDMEKAMKKGSNPKEFKMRLAKELVTLYHGADEAAKAEDEFTRVFAQGGMPEDIPEATIAAGTSVLQVIVDEKLAPSKSEAKRLIEQGGVKLDDDVISALDTPVKEGILRVGKRKFLRIILK